MTRKKICISIKKELLEKIDRDVIDSEKIRTRSHAIEYLLSQALPPKISKALILTAGKGVKMRPFTYELPKAMLSVKARPILDHILELLRNNGIREVILLVDSKGDKIRSHFGDGSHYGVKITYLEEKKPSGTAIPLKKAKDLLGNEPFLLIYGDVLAKINLKEMMDFHEESGALATMAVTSVEETGDWGVVNLRGNRIISFIEKPKKPGLSHLVNAGIFILEPEVLNHIPTKKFSRLETDVFPKLVKEDKVAGYIFEGQWFDVGTPKTYERAIKEWQG
jgi:NDP-sugar pyrophosphorylase family protein